MRIRGRRWSLARQLLVLQLAGVAAVVAVGGCLAYLDASRATHDQARDKVIAVAATIADSPVVLAAASTPEPRGALQPFAERVRVD
ncbi:MAG: two-component system, CitB family, sensor kinase, partial [Pseudonocardiales bacterium]|nr:two-component system, CitB family, sensor kinase [Pseudonocardiales bacterium]